MVEFHGNEKKKLPVILPTADQTRAFNSKIALSPNGGLKLRSVTAAACFT